MVDLIHDGGPPGPLIVLRGPCKRCSSGNGYYVTKTGQDVVYCAQCGTHQGYNASKVETGRAVRSISTTHEAISPSKRWRIIEKANGHCESCGRAPSGGFGLHVSHLLSVKDGHAFGMTDQEINDDENLAAFCEECNLGQGSCTVSAKLLFAIVMARIKKGQKVIP